MNINTLIGQAIAAERALSEAQTLAAIARAERRDDAMTLTRTAEMQQERLWRIENQIAQCLCQHLAESRQVVLRNSAPRTPDGLH